MTDYKRVPVEPTREMLDRAVSFALNVTISGDYNWSAYMRDVYGRMLAAAPEPPADGWRTIETAPKNGRSVMLCRWVDPHQDILPIFSGFWSLANERWYDDHNGQKIVPTHWQPLPAPPTLSRQSQE